MRAIWTLFFIALFWGTLAAAGDLLPSSTPSGILADRVLPLAHLEDLDGSLASPRVDQARWRQVLHELSRAAEKPLGWPTERELAAAATIDRPRNEVPLAVLWTAYDRLNEEGIVQPARVFTFTPLRQKVYHGQNLAFTLAAANILTQWDSKFATWALDADDGEGWRDFIPGQALQVAYRLTGPKTLRMRAELEDGSLLYGSALLDVKRLVTPDPTETWPITASESYQGAVATGLAHLYLAEGHAALTNPVVVVEGFDLDNSMDWPVLYDLLNQENLLEDLRTAGNDAVVLDFTEATEPIQRNAFVLTQLLAQVRAAAGQEATIALVGASMGGLVSRYGLTWLEFQGLDSGVRTFISFDSPQRGANIPLGLQYWLNFFKDESADAGFLLSRLNTPAARQMLLYHYTDPPTETPGPDPLFDAFQTDLADLGDWPVQPRLAAVANGSGLNADQGFAAGQQLIYYEYRSLLADIDGNVWSVPADGSQVIFDGMINLIWPLPDTYQTVTVAGTLPWDSAPGGYRPSLAQMDTTAVPYGDIVALHDAHCFIPTVSALALTETDPFFDIAGAADLLALTPFDAVYWPDANQEHIAVTPENKAWFLSEVQQGVSSVGDVPGPLTSRCELYPATPNPFNPSTKISFRLSGRDEVTLQIYDLAGRLVSCLVQGEVYEAGRHTVTWAGNRQGGGVAASGTYLCRLRVGGEARTGRLTLLK